MKSIDDILIKDATQLMEIDRELEDAKGRVNQLRRQRLQVQSHMNQYRQLISPIWHLPLELLGEIFRHCIPSTFERGWMSRGRQRGVIISLSHVCRRWRGAALRNPHLWTTVDVGRPVNDPQLRNEISFATAWLSRTGTLPISLKLCQSMREWRGQTSALVSQYSNQLEYLELHNSGSILLAGRRVEFLRLRTLVLSGTGSVAHCFGRPLELMKMAPELRILKLALYIAPRFLALPWGQLSELFLTHEYYAADECVQLLQLASNVKTCELRLGIRKTYWALPASPHVTCVPLLKSLTLTANTNAQRFFRRFNFPALEELDICVDEEGCWAPNELEKLLARSSCPLYRLKIAVLDEDNDVSLDQAGGLQRCLENVPSLVELELPTKGSSARLSGSLIFDLTRFYDDDPLSFLPNLQILRFYYDEDIFDSDLTTMIESRWKTGAITKEVSGMAHLEVVEIVGLDEGEDDHIYPASVLFRLSQLADDGLDIYASDVNGDRISLKRVLEHPR